MNINLIPDASVASAPAGFVQAVQAAANIFDGDFPGNYTVNIGYGWGTWDNAPESSLTNPGSGVFSIGGPTAGVIEDYTTIKSWLAADATSTDQIAALSSLPANASAFPAGASSFYVSAAQEIAQGETPETSDGLDGAIGFNIADASNPADWIGGALCEITHALGWIPGYYVGGAPTVADLFRYAAPGEYQWVGGEPAYFSIDGGAASLANFSTTFDYTLFTNIAPNDPLNVAGITGSTQNLTSLDLEALSVIGFTAAAAQPAPLISQLTPDQQIELIYVGYFGRAPDASGFAFWEGQLASAEAHGQSLGTAIVNIANSFAPQPETDALYPILTPGVAISPSSSSNVAAVQQLIDSVYANLFGRTINAASDSGGEYWVDQILTGSVPVGESILAIANGAQGSDATVVMNKIAVSDYWLSASEAHGVGAEPPVSSNLLAEMHTILSSVTASPASVSASEAAINSFVSAYGLPSAVGTTGVASSVHVDHV
jgi:hypothetical protein